MPISSVSKAQRDQERRYRIAARTIGVSTEEYTAFTDQGLAWCSKCRQWKDKTTAFGKSLSTRKRYAYCKECYAKRDW